MTIQLFNYIVNRIDSISCAGNSEIMKIERKTLILRTKGKSQ